MNKFFIVKDVVIAMVAILALLVSIKSCSIANSSLNASTESNENYKKVEKLELNPEIKFNINFEGIKGSPPYFTIQNFGPIDATQVVVELVINRYDQEKDRFINIFSTDQRVVINNLSTLQSKSYEISQHFLDVNSRLGKPLNQNVIEARISYRKEPDLQLFIKRAFYFIDPAGKWVGENNNNLKDEIYSIMKESLLNKFNDTGILFHGDALHDLDISQIKNEK